MCVPLYEVKMKIWPIMNPYNLPQCKFGTLQGKWGKKIQKLCLITTTKLWHFLYEYQ